MMSVARMIDSSTLRPVQSRNTKEKAAIEQIAIDSTTVTTVTPTEFSMNSPIGARSKAAK